MQLEMLINKDGFSPDVLTAFFYKLHLDYVDGKDDDDDDDESQQIERIETQLQKARSMIKT